MSQCQMDLVEGVLKFVTRAVQEGQLSALSEFGLDLESLRRLESLTFRDVTSLSRMGGHFLTIRIDPTAFELMYARLEEERQELWLQDEYLRRGAPAALMRALFGLPESETYKRKRTLNAPSDTGRPPLPAGQELFDLLARWEQLRSEEPDERKRFLRLAQASEHSLTTLWSLIQREAEFLERRLIGEPRRARHRRSRPSPAAEAPAPVEE